MGGQFSLDKKFEMKYYEHLFITMEGILRPKKTRWIKCIPGERCFKPLCQPLTKLRSVNLTLDEFESVRLADLEGLKQVDAAKKMRISRPTFSRIIAAAHQKIADGLVNIKAIKIEGGCCKIIRR